MRPNRGSQFWHQYEQTGDHSDNGGLELTLYVGNRSDERQREVIGFNLALKAAIVATNPHDKV